MSNQQAANKPAGKQFLLSMLLPVIESQLDKDRAMQLQGLYARKMSNNINKDEFVRLMRSLVGDHMIKMAVFKLQQGQLTRQVASGIGTGAAGKSVSEIEHEETDVGKGDVEGPMVAGGVLIGSKNQVNERWLLLRRTLLQARLIQAEGSWLFIQIRLNIKRGKWRT
ncbi:uncharacterized protein LOC143608060 [Bidens hawaiensis]|uniref:uncharacterized protein LOC143608060 n=1 Tax=Bidens hawaiensis TaxID=980011 RepID=UPI00404AF019